MKLKYQNVDYNDNSFISPKYNFQNNEDYYKTNNDNNINFNLNKTANNYYPKNIHNKNQNYGNNFNNININNNFNINITTNSLSNNDRKEQKSKKKHQDDAYNKINIENVKLIFIFR